MKAFGKILDERATSCRAGFVQCDIANAAIPDKETLHILSADIEHKGNFRTKLLRRAKMRKRFHLAAIRMKRRLDNCFAVSSGHSAGNPGLFRHSRIKLPNLFYHRFQRRPLIAAIGGIQNLFIPADRRDLCRRRPGIDTDIHGPFILGKITTFNLIAVMTCFKRLIFRIILEQRKIRLARLTGRCLLCTFNTRIELPYIDFLRFVRKRRTHGDKIIAVIYFYNLIVLKPQRLNKTLPQFRQKMQRAAQKSDMPRNRPPLRQIANGLIDHSLKDRQRNIRFFRPIIHQGLNVRFGKNPAARSDRIDLLSLSRQLIESRRIRRKKRSHMIDERPRTAGADPVHTLFRRIAKIGDLRILAAELHHGIGPGNQLPDRCGTGNHFLHKRQADALSNPHAS